MATEATKNNTVKQQVLESTLLQIDKQFGRGSVMVLGKKQKTCVDAISTGSIQIDEALGTNGFPRGRIIEVFGPESSGKTTLTLHAIAQAQLAGGTCAFIDAEHALDPDYAARIGINIDNLIISQPDYGEQAIDIAEMLIRSGAVDLLVIDSVAALVPKAEIEGDMEDQGIGLQARLMSRALRVLTPIVHKSRTVLIFINQIRQKIGAMPYAPQETTSGGSALKFYASLRIEVKRVATIKKLEQPIGSKVSIKIVKNKLASPFKRVEVDFIFGCGISRELDLLDVAIAVGIVKQSGAWFTCGEIKLAQGRDNCVSVLKDNKELFAKIMQLVKDKKDLVRTGIQDNSEQSIQAEGEGE